jgi:hypothetical protein
MIESASARSRAVIDVEGSAVDIVAKHPGGLPSLVEFECFHGYATIERRSVAKAWPARTVSDLDEVEGKVREALLSLEDISFKRLDALNSVA